MNPSVWKLNQTVVEKCSDFGPFRGYISEMLQDIGGKLVLITNRKSHMSFRLVPKSTTLNDLERRNGRYFTEFGKHAFQHITASICGGIYAPVYCIL